MSQCGYSISEGKTQYLLQLVQSYLLKDIMAFEDIRQSEKIIKLLRLIAFQCGAEVSYNELAGQLGISKNTVETYLDCYPKYLLFTGLEHTAPTSGRKFQNHPNGIFMITGFVKPS